MDIQKLEAEAKTIRRHIIESLHCSGSGHPGGSLSCVEILVSLYFNHMKIDSSKPEWEERDRFVLSKGHAAPALYAALAERGYFPVAELKTLRKINSLLQGHPALRKTPGVDMTSGSLGQGISASVGIALASKISSERFGKRRFNVYTLIGDGECQSGQVWEAAMAGAHYKLGHLTAILDYNGLQIDGPNEEIMGIAPIADKWQAFGWEVIEIDGHKIDEILDALNRANINPEKPAIIIARTVKGKGVSFMENQYEWHGKPITDEVYQKAMKELSAPSMRTCRGLIPAPVRNMFIKPAATGVINVAPTQKRKFIYKRNLSYERREKIHPPGVW